MPMTTSAMQDFIEGGMRGEKNTIEPWSAKLQPFYMTSSRATSTVQTRCTSRTYVRFDVCPQLFPTFMQHTRDDRPHEPAGTRIPLKHVRKTSCDCDKAIRCCPWRAAQEPYIGASLHELFRLRMSCRRTRSNGELSALRVESLFRNFRTHRPSLPQYH